MGSIKSAEYDKAIKLFNKVIAQSPDNPVPYINLALVYEKMQNLALAEENLKLAIKLDPENPVASNEYALLYRKSGRFTEARQIYEKILGKHPDFIMAHKNLGILCDLYMKDYKCALKEYVIYSGLMPDDGNVKVWIADMQKRS
jgi:tetratricopeptide (TPR) repeat protein